MKTFLFRAGKVIVSIVAVLAFLNSLGTDGTFGNEDSDKSVLSEIGRDIVPIFAPMGVQEQNWPAAVGVFTGIFAKEAVVGTLNSLYDTITLAKAEEERGCRRRCSLLKKLLRKKKKAAGPSPTPSTKLFRPLGKT